MNTGFVKANTTRSSVACFSNHGTRSRNAWSWLNKRGKPTPLVGARHESDMPLWFPSANTTDTFAVDAMINFINTLDPNRPLKPTTRKNGPSWPKCVETENFRVEPIRFLYNFLLTVAKEGKSG
ncbi:hypothetical protein B0H15DRAFT_943876 [Mycena belliarum]|uniref:Uncharacterized protein n=1 Tax=Mycena belliarum TaxID=1033014 RepID=A0AAD6UFK3_9AGAR|nr:hypothetical protein B0H15DRAFT_943876 [Mycena belliae]